MKRTILATIETLLSYYPGEQRTLMKRILKNLTHDPKKWNERAILGRFQRQRQNDLLDEVAYEHQAGDMYTQIVAKCYKAYRGRAPFVVKLWILTI